MNKFFLRRPIAWSKVVKPFQLLKRRLRGLDSFWPPFIIDQTISNKVSTILVFFMGIGFELIPCSLAFGGAPIILEPRSCAYSSFQYEVESSGYYPDKGEADLVARLTRDLEIVNSRKLVTSRWRKKISNLRHPSDFSDDLLWDLALSMAEQRFHLLPKWLRDRGIKSELFASLKKFLIATDWELTGGFLGRRQGTSLQISLVVPHEPIHPLLRISIVLHEWEHATQYVWVRESGQSDLDLFEKSCAYPMLKSLKEKMAIHLEWSILHLISSQVKRRIWEESREVAAKLPSTTRDGIAFKLLTSHRGYEHFYRNALRLRAYTCHDLMNHQQFPIRSFNK